LYSSGENHALWEILGDDRYGSEKSGSRVELSVAQGCFQGLAQRHDFLMGGAVSRRLAAFSNCLLVSVNSKFLDLSCGDL
jgi:hypothetical protein